jgi:hypothetical protein
VAISVSENGKIEKLFFSESQNIRPADSLFTYLNQQNVSTTVLAPISGKIALISPLYNLQKIKKGQMLFYIKPNQKQFYGVLFINEQQRKRVKPGQLVIFKPASGALSNDQSVVGAVKYISEIDSGHGYFTRVEFLENKYLKAVSDMSANDSGTAEIIISKERLINKFLGQNKFVHFK